MAVPLRFGIQSSPQHVTYAELLALWQAADGMGYDTAWLFDHFEPISGDPYGACLEGWTTLTALCMQTRRLHAGALVFSVGYRHPAVLANMGAALDIASGGRLELAMGAGWNEREYRAYGLPFPPTGVRLRQLNEYVQVVRRLWTEPRANFAGEFYTLTDAPCEPKPAQRPSPPIWIGGQGEKVTLRIVAEHADGWDMDLAPLDAYRRKLDILSGHCAAVGRDFNSLRRMLHFSGIIAEDGAEVRARAEQLARDWSTGVDELRGRVLIGTPAQCAAQLAPYAALGVTDFVLSVAAPYDMEMVRLFGQEVKQLLGDSM